MQTKTLLLTFAILITINSLSQHPFRHWTEANDIRYSMKQPVIHYDLTVDATDFSSVHVAMKIKNVADSFRIAMFTHPEYDDRYWRYVEDLSVVSKSGAGKIFRLDSSLWKIITNGGEATINYRIHLPKPEGIRSSWKAYMTPSGGLIGGPHSFMYIVGAELAPSHVKLHMPNDWQIATGLQSTLDPTVFFSPTVSTLVDDPIFVGKFRSWNFSVEEIPHRLIYWSENTVSFDTASLLSSIQKLVTETAQLFGRLPYRDYIFMLQDGAVGSLEHANSVTTGATASQLLNNMTGVLFDITHEYFHSWNLMRIRPTGYGEVIYKTHPLSKGLWFSEGLTIFYSDLLLRRAGLPLVDSTRLIHLQNLIRRYSANPAYEKFSAETISEASYAPVGMLGNYSASTHLQGEVLGAILDFIIRDATNGQKSMDDLMKKMLEKFSGEKGFTSRDVEQTASEVSGVNLHSFFQDYVFGKKPIDFDKYLRLLGLQYEMEWKDVINNDGKPTPDLRIFSYQLPGENITRIGITNPGSSWGKAALNTGDELKSINGTAVTAADFRSLIRNAKIGDTIAVEVKRNSKIFKSNVVITTYQQPVVKISQLPNHTEKQQKLFEQWLTGN
jgi:predicted metalloprotease with PDZ domain